MRSVRVCPFHEPLSSDWDWGLGLGTGIGDRDWGLGLGTGIGDKIIIPLSHSCVKFNLMHCIICCKLS